MKRLPVFVLLLLTSPLRAFFFSPGSDVKVLETDYFDIIYTDATALSALHMAEQVDAVYERVADLLDAFEPDFHIPVVLSDREGDTNGFTTLYPYTKIVLYDVPPEPESTIGNTDDYIVDLFTHELVHAVSLNIRGSFWKVLRRVGGDYYSSPNINWMMPMHMVEGVTVSFESLDGFGRLNDPYIGQHLLQAALEDRFLSPAAASGALDCFPYAAAYYYYGGFFSRYLQETYGMETYARLWRETGRGLIIPGFAGAFKRVYGLKLEEAWEAFADTFDGGTEKPKTPILLSSRGDYIGDMAISSGLVYYISVYDGSVRSFDPATGKDRHVLSLPNAGAATVDVSADGKLLVVSLLEETRDGTMRIVRLYDTEKHRFQGSGIPYMREAAAVSRGVAGVLVEEGRTVLALHHDGVTETLLTAGKGVVFGAVREPDAGVYVFTATVDGRRGIYRYTQKMGMVEEILLPLEHAAFPRDLTVGEDLYFSYNDDYSFYRLGTIRSGRFYRQAERTSGGVLNPLILNNHLYYTGLFSDGWYLAEDPAGLENLEEVGEVGYRETDRIFPPGAFPQENQNPGEFTISSYSSLKGMLPRFVLPYISSGSLVVDENGEYTISGFDAFGLKTYTADPAEGNEASLYAGYSWRVPFAEAGFRWDHRASAVDVFLDVSDDLLYSEIPGATLRRSGTAAGVSYGEVYPSSGFRFGLTGSGTASFDALEESRSGPYGWEYIRGQYSALLSAQAGYALPGCLDLSGYLQGSVTGSGDLSQEVELSPYLRGTLAAERSYPGHLTLSGRLGGTFTPDSPGITETNLSLSLGNLHSRYPGYLDYRGASLKGYLDYRPGENLWKTGGVLSASPAGFPLYGRLYGALSSAPVFSTQGSVNFLSGAGYPLYTEFAGSEAVSSFYTGSDLELRLFNLEVQRRAWFLPVFLNRVQMSAGYRAAWMGEPFYHSVFARAGMTFSPLVGSNARLHFAVRIEAAYSFTGRQFSFSLF